MDLESPPHRTAPHLSVFFLVDSQPATNGGLAESGSTSRAAPPSPSKKAPAAAATATSAPAKSPDAGAPTPTSAPAPVKKMMFPKQAAAQAARNAAGERPPPTTDSWDNEPVVVSRNIA